MKRRILMFSYLLITASLTSEAQIVYSINDCIRIGLEQNYSMLIARNNEAISNNNMTLGNAGFLPSIDIASRYSGSLSDLKQQPRDGGDKIITNDIFNSTSNTGVNLGLTIFNGFNVHLTYKKLKELKEIGALNTQLSIENLIADILISYYNYIQQVKRLNNLEYGVSLSKERLRIDEERYLLGSNSKLQVLQSRVNLNADSSILTKQSEVVKAAKIRMHELMATEDLDSEFNSLDTLITVNPTLLYEFLIEETLAGNTFLLISSKNTVVSEYDHKIVSSRSYPSINLSSGYSLNINAFSGGTIQNQSTNATNFGLTMGFNIFDGLNQRRSIKNSALELKNKELSYLETEQTILADLITIYYTYNNNLRLIKLEEESLNSASENLDIAFERYRLGSLSGIELREVQKSLLDAKERLISISYQAKVAEISLKLISGNIMEYYK